MSKIHINLDQNSYNIEIGSNICHKIADFLEEENYSKIIIISDKNLSQLHLEQFGVQML